ncbi:MAG TPA: zinc ribbon domain-containing protein [Syntrophales bacterium]|nr:zinc ribbon domain-containing protein [Syntrophales bacterium]
MPIYEFECKKCKNVFEVLFRPGEAQTGAPCPACHSRRTKRLMSAFAGKIGNTAGGAGCGTCSATSCGPT